jgi:hypothetical protein
MGSAWARITHNYWNSSPPILANYWTSILRDPGDEIQLPVRPYGGATILRRIKHEHNGLVAGLVAVSSSATLRVMDRVEQNVLSDKIDPKNFADAFIRDLNMLALVAALIAQLSITTFALPMLSSAHWVCKAGLAGSLSFGTLAAWFSSNMARNLSSLDSAEDIKSWLSRPAGKKVLEDFCSAYVTRFRDIEAASDEQKRFAKEDIVNFIQENKWKQASYSSCFLLALPSVLLNFSVALLLTALAVYLGDVWRSKLDPVAGDIPSRAVFICYTLALGCALLVFSWACRRKDAELHSLRNLISQLKDT